MPTRLALTAAVIAALTLPASAQNYDGTPDDRYAVVQLADGVLRVDRETGAVTTCKEQGTGWVCLTAADEREALQAEIDRLSAQNKELADRVSELRARLETTNKDGKGDKSAKSDILRYFKDPPPLTKRDEEELQKFLGVTEKAFRGFFGVMRELEKDWKSEEKK